MWTRFAIDKERKQNIEWWRSLLRLLLFVLTAFLTKAWLFENLKNHEIHWQRVSFDLEFHQRTFTLWWAANRISVAINFYIFFVRIIYLIFTIPTHNICILIQFKSMSSTFKFDFVFFCYFKVYSHFLLFLCHSRNGFTRPHNCLYLQTNCVCSCNWQQHCVGQ